ncbi:DUF7882 family protein [Microbacterium sp. JZ31]|uniref:DUF7882 family protein n=1 Tax=Microbacterium sp. JZ31 TaxID=1906274 RepID=UPI0019336E19|nr:hypothetical protein [Microbacterium sp. JZ31]
MGQLYYDHMGPAVDVDDRTLAHLKAVITTKLRRSESFTLSWQAPDRHGRTTVWIHPSIPVKFLFDGQEPTQLNRDWIQRLADSALEGRGIILTGEHEDSGAPTAS